MSPAQPSRLVVLAKALLHGGTFALYGFHRDELYLLACGRRVAWGSVDHGPVTPALARVQEVLFGGTPAGLRVASVIAGVLTVWLTARLARRLGGDATAQAIAAGCTAIAPIFLWGSGVFGTIAIDQLAWVAAALLFVEERWWALGVVLGVALLNKLTAGMLVVLLLARPRRGALVAAAVAAGVWAPSVIWQAAHGWPALSFLGGTHAAVAARGSTLGRIFDQPRLLHPFAFVVAMIGLGAAVGRRDLRPFAILWGVTLVAVLAAPGKAYYVAPAYPPLFAIGAIACARHWRRSLTALFAVGGLVALVGTLPLVRGFNQELVQFADWRAVAAQIDAVADGRLVVTDSYGTAAALERFGRSPVASGANSWHAWGPPAEPVGDVVVIGYEGICAEREAIGQVAFGDEDNRFDFPRTIWRCRLRAPLAVMWPELKRFD